MRIMCLTCSKIIVLFRWYDLGYMDGGQFES